ncbi:hypothetical protein SPV1_11641 [Mariprofundus ferrooxydans PV-1]|uniref:Uncharacterized protein n=1 Tax=Mariprofundus ferrooxydans PV-1 TaxID=314345 RepID=Q0F108_9PROT|nr:hypothetical protein SPV1_11641 [Mariprofundus ferrooxydans PV-1]
MQRLSQHAQAKARGLLRILLLGRSALSAGPAGRSLLPLSTRTITADAFLLTGF